MDRNPRSKAARPVLDPAPFQEEVEVQGHIVDSLLLHKILDRILQMGGTFEIRECRIGSRRVDPSYARILVRADSAHQLAEILGDLVEHGASTTHAEDAEFHPADLAGCFPEGFYCTTNQRTEVRVGGRWLEVAGQEMDCGIALDEATHSARCVPMIEVTPGTPILVGHAGVLVSPAERSREPTVFGFMGSAVSTEKPKAATLRGVAAAMRATRAEGKKILLVGGPAIVHTGSASHVAQLIRDGWVQTLFAGNALATHDIEQSLYGTSLGVSLDRGEAIEHGHEHHLRAINTIRRVGGIRPAVESGLVTSGIFYECIRHQIDMVLAGSIRDDGPLPDVITDTIKAQARMREAVQDVGVALMIATALHSIATGNILPARVRVVCVDINPSTITKLSDRGTFQTVGLVTDVEPFFRSLVGLLSSAD